MCCSNLDAHAYIIAPDTATRIMLSFNPDMQASTDPVQAAVTNERSDRPAGGAAKADIRAHDGTAGAGRDCHLVGGVSAICIFAPSSLAGLGGEWRRARGENIRSFCDDSCGTT